MAQAMNLTQIAATIANGAALSAEIDLGANVLCGINMPAVWSAAAMTFQVSTDGGVTWNEMTTSAGAAVSYTVASAQYIAVDPLLWAGINALKIRSGTVGAPVNQGQAVALTLLTKQRI